jgi:hypothetical protein
MPPLWVVCTGWCGAACLTRETQFHELLDSDFVLHRPSITPRSGGRCPSRSSLPCSPSVRQGANLLSRASSRTMSPPSTSTNGVHHCPKTEELHQMSSFSTLFTACKVRNLAAVPTLAHPVMALLVHNNQEHFSPEGTCSSLQLQQKKGTCISQI